MPYFYQHDNWTKYHGPGGRQCNLTAHCMAADYLLKGEIGQMSKAKGDKEPETTMEKSSMRMAIPLILKPIHPPIETHG